MVSFQGRCERYVLTPGTAGADSVVVGGPGGRLVVDSRPGRAPGSPHTWLRPLPGSFEVPVSAFRQQLFVPPASCSCGAGAGAAGEGGEEAPAVFSRLELPLAGGGCQRFAPAPT